jgi:hypothetical protein
MTWRKRMKPKWKRCLFIVTISLVFSRGSKREEVETTISISHSWDIYPCPE